MRRIAIINQKGGVGKTTTTVNLGAALAIQGRRVVVVDMDAQANLSLALGVEAASESPTSYTVLLGTTTFAEALRATNVPNLTLVASHLDLSGAEMELASAMGREFLLRDAIGEWDELHRKKRGKPAADYVLFDCPPSLGLLSINALAAAGFVLITLQTEFLALQGMTKLVGVVQLLKKRLNPSLEIAGIAACLYDCRLKLEREVLGEIRGYFGAQVFPQPIRRNIKLAEAPSFGQTIFEYAPDSHGAVDYMQLAREVIAREATDPDLAKLPPFDASARLPASAVNAPAPSKRVPPPPRAKKIPPTAKAPEKAASIEAFPAGKKRALQASNELAASRDVDKKNESAAPRAPTKKPLEIKPATTARKSKPFARDVIPTRDVAKISHDDMPPLPPDAFEILSTPFEP